MTFLTMPSVNELLDKKQNTGVLLHKCFAETAEKTSLRGLFAGDKKTAIASGQTIKAA